MRVPRRLTRLAQRLLAQHGYQIVQVKPAPLSAARGAEIDLLELVVRDFLHTHSQLEFLQVGAFDGMSNDAVYPLVKKYPLSGTLVEPQESAFAALRDNYAGITGRSLTFVNAAVGEHDGVATLYSVQPGAPCPKYLAQTASFGRQHLLRCGRGVPNFASMIEEHPVRCVTFGTLFRETGIQHVDLLHVDAEGFDAEILKLFEIPARKPAIVRFEWGHLPPKEHDECISMLIANGYRVAVGDMDTLAYRQT